MATTGNFVLVVIGWDDANRLRSISPPPLDSIHILVGEGCSTCANGKRLVIQVSGAALINTDAAEMHVLQFASEATAQGWVNETITAKPDAFAGKQVYGYVPNWARS